MGHERASHQGVEELRSCCDGRRTARNVVLESLALGEVELTGLQADGLRLTDVDLRGATLNGSEWVDCTLRDVRLERVIGHALIMRMCTLEGVRASEADLRGAKLENSQALGIALDRVTLAEGSLIDSDLTRASLREANLQNVEATGVILRGADLRGADLRGAVLVDADLRGADLRGARLDEADLMGADLRGAITAEDEEAEPEATQAPAQPALSPQFAQLVDALAPTVVDILQRGKRRGVLDEAAFAHLVKDLGQLGVANLEPAQSLLAEDAPMAQILKRVNEVGIGPLIASLGGRDGRPDQQPPPAVAQLIKSLMGDAKLAPHATAEDLAVHLTKLVQSSLPRQGSHK